MKLFSKTFIAGAIAFFVGFGTIFGAQGVFKAMSPATNNEEETFSTQKEMPHQRILLDNLLNMGEFSVNGGIDFTLEDDTCINVGVDFVGDISDINNIKLAGNADLYLNGLSLSSNISYFKDSDDANDKGTIYFSYKENNFYLETAHLLDFIDMLPTDYNINLNLPEELTNLDLRTISDMIDGMEERTSTNGDIYFVLALNEELNLYVKTDSSYNFKGLRTDTIKYQGAIIKLDIDLEKAEDVELVKPNKAQYQNFKPIFNVFKAIYNFTNKKQNAINVSALVSKLDEKDKTSYNEFVDATIDLGYDVNAKSFQIDADLKENDRHHKVGMLFEDSTAYLDIRASKVSIKFDSVKDTLSYILSQIDLDFTDKLVDKLSELLSSDEFASLREGLSNLVGEIKLTNSSISIELDLDALGLKMGKIVPTISFIDGELKSIVIDNLKIKDYKLDLSLTFGDYAHKSIIKDKYVEFEPALTIVEAVMPLIKESQFRIEFSALVDSSEVGVNDINIDGGLQFNVTDHGFGYGQVTIVDRDSYRHNIKADMKTKDEFLFSYNDTLNGKFSSKTLKEIYALVSDIINNPDDHFIELFGELIESFKNTPITKVMKGDYLAILESQIINSLEITETGMKMNISLAIIGMEDKTCDFEILYHRENDVAYLDGVRLSNLELGSNSITFSANLKQFDETKENERLDAYEEYLDFSDIKVLLQLGINTSKFEYFHFSAKLRLNLHLVIDIDRTIDLDIQIRNNKGKVQVAAELSNIPIIDVIKVINLNANDDYIGTDKRDASIYFDEDTFYIKRVDDVHTFLSINKYRVTYGATYSTEYFLDNIAEIMLQDVLGVRDQWMDSIVGDHSSESSSNQIEYEKLLKDFRYDSNEGTFTFKIDLYSLTHVSMLQTADLIVYEDKESEQLSKVDIKLTIHMVLNINISLSLETVSKDAILTDDNKLTTMDSWIASREGAQLNKFVEISKVKR